MLAFPQMINFGNDFQKYMAALTIWHNQQNQDAENQKIHDDFVTAAARWVTQTESQIAYHQPTQAAPPLPVMNIYNDDGTVSPRPFPDLTAPALPATTPSGPVTSPPAADRTDAMMLMLQNIITTQQAILKKLGV